VGRIPAGSIVRQRSRDALHPILVASIALQLVWLLVLSIPVACVTWTVTHEEVFREPREYCQEQSKIAVSLPRRKFFYLFTCEYCFSHYISALFLILTGFKVLYSDWRGYLIAFFSLVWVANQYISIYNHLRLDIKHEQVQIQAEQKRPPSRDNKAA
jgi:hypothetical protein